MSLDSNIDKQGRLADQKLAAANRFSYPLDAILIKKLQAVM